ncbi:hypothetical protein Pint_21849 [Pistacia integerrima]|uniref:Uncharacterized protein n=1 Tax=Pistacia integerrima TaxID=434235 RepID=A0ACC0XE31_9ROSI|nr:hypothetical protein Pint_21849 [Pistacia integerrima]
MKFRFREASLVEFHDESRSFLVDTRVSNQRAFVFITWPHPSSTSCVNLRCIIIRRSSRPLRFEHAE